MGLLHLILLLFSVDLGVMAMKRYSTFSRAPKLELRHEIPRMKRSTKETLKFVKILLLAFSTYISASFPLVGTLLKHFFGYGEKINHYIFLSSTSSDLTRERNFLIRKQKKKWIKKKRNTRTGPSLAGM